MGISLKSVSKPRPVAGLEAAAAAPPRRVTCGSPGSAAAEPSRSFRSLVAVGRGDLPQPSRPVPAGLESVIGLDDRTRILDTDLAPWRMICALRMRGESGGTAVGTGWLVGPRTVLTAGHCVFSTYFFDGWAKTVELSAGRDGSEFPYDTVSSERFSSVDRWVKKEEPDFDIGCIHLDEPLGEKVGWFQVAALPPEELGGFLVNVSGYPADLGRGTEQYHHRNKVRTVTERRVFYDVDTFGGQSGAPVWIHADEKSPPLAVGIHAYGVGGATPGPGRDLNSAPRIIPEVLDQIEAWVAEDGGWPQS